MTGGELKPRFLECPLHHFLFPVKRKLTVEMMKSHGGAEEGDVIPSYAAEV